ncbi:PIG-L family deacetylase [Streptomyces sp. NPDC006733]|uniref:PIG-L deacetylase family protein n=1 Tax=Streptomyces sp. NPDC006733 TaxID=3155460 RepID=UPI0033E98051
MTTVIAFHAHPDDEAILTGGTLARLAAEGHRVVVAVACDGMGGAASGRLDELRASAALLGVARVVHLGYADSGHGPLLFPDPPNRVRFARADPAEAAAKLAALLREERAGLLLSYDAQGGYGHRDHVKVHEVGAAAARLTGTRVLEATRPREPIARLARLLSLAGYDAEALRAAYTPTAQITHRIDVRRYAPQKQAALAAHRSQVATGKGRASALFRLLTRLPPRLFGLLLGTEWFREPGSDGSTSR